MAISPVNRFIGYSTVQGSVTFVYFYIFKSFCNLQFLITSWNLIEMKLWFNYTKRHREKQLWQLIYHYYCFETIWFSDGNKRRTSICLRQTVQVWTHPVLFNSKFIINRNVARHWAKHANRMKLKHLIIRFAISQLKVVAHWCTYVSFSNGRNDCQIDWLIYTRNDLTCQLKNKLDITLIKFNSH